MLADSIMAQQEELELRQRSAAEQQRWRDAESEEESDSEGEGEVGEGRQQQGAAAGPSQQQPQDGGAGCSAVGAGIGGEAAAAAAEQQMEGGEEDAEEEGAGEGPGTGPSFVRISEDEAAANAEALLDVMKQRFLAGRDAGMDYAAIDAGAWSPASGCFQQRKQAAGRAGQAHARLPAHSPGASGGAADDLCLPLPQFTLQTRTWTRTGQRSGSRTPRTPGSAATTD